VWDGPLRVVVSQSFGKQGNRQGTPVTYHWRWYHHVPGLALWAIVFLLLAGRRANRSFPAWAILIPLGLVSTAWRVPLAIVGMSPGDWESLGIFFLTIAIGLSIVWLLGDWLARRPIRWRMASALGVMLVVIAVSYPLHF